MLRVFPIIVVPLLLLVVRTAVGTKSYVLNSLNLQTVEEIKSELVASNRLLLGNETSGEYEYDEAILDRDLMEQLRNMTIRVLARKIFPFICFEEFEGGQQILSGFVGEIWNTLEEHLGFRTQLIAGMKNARGWDVLLNPRELSLNKLARYSYTFPIAKIWYNLFAKGRPYSGNSVAYYHIFDRKLWSVIIVASLVLSLSLWGTWKVRRKALELSRYIGRSELTTDDTNYSTCILSVLGCMINQGSQFKTEKSSSIRIITLMCILLGLVITTSFSALLISKLATVGDVTDEKLNLRSLAESPRGRTLCIATHSYAYNRITVNVGGGITNQLNGAPLGGYSSDNLKTLNLSQREAPSFPCTPGDHDLVPSRDYCAENTVILETIYNANHAMDADPVIDQDSCVVYIYHKKYFNSHLILVVRKGFPYLRIINKYLLRMKESGLEKKLTEAWQPSQSQHRIMDKEAKTRSKLKVSFYHIKPIILAYVGAVVFSLLILAMERLYKWLGDN